MPNPSIQMNVFSLALFVVGFSAGALFLFSLSRRPAPGARLLAGIMWATALWSFGYALELASVDQTAILFWVRIEYLGIAAIQVLWIPFVLQYVGRERWLTRSRAPLFLVIPVCTVLLNYTNSWHHLYYASVHVLEADGLTILALRGGPWYWVNAAYGYFVLLTGSVLLIRHVIYSPTLYRQQVWALVVAALAPMIGNVLYLLGLTPVAYLDLTPFAFVVTGLAISWGFYHLRLFDVTPIARDSLIETLRDGMLVLDAQGRIIDFNPAARDYLALDKSAVGQPVHTIRTAWPGLAEFCQAKQQVRGEIVVEHSAPAYLEVIHSPLYNHSNRFVGSLLALHDITEHKEVEAAERARQIAEAASRAKSQFLATMSHEVRTPMQGVIGLIEMLLETPLAPEQTEIGETVRTSAETVLAILNDILDISKIEANKFVLHQENFDLRALLDTVYRMFVLQAQEKTIHLVHEVEPEVPLLLHGDSMRLRQILVNLIGNAIKFTDGGEVVVHVALEETSQDDPVTLHFAIRDTGIGIPAARLPHLFQVFVQGDSSTHRKYGGSGLGLAICKQLAERMGGRVGVESVEGQGSTFWFTAVLDQQSVSAQPFKAAVDKPSQPMITAVAGDDRTPTQAGPSWSPGDAACHRALLAEDNQTSQKIVLVMLAKLGCITEVANNGLEVVEAFSNHVYDLILMDVAMPQMDGLEATRRIRQMELEDQHTPIVALTAHAMSDDRVRCLAAGMDDYMTKPIRLPELAALLKQWVHSEPDNTTQPK